MAEAKYERIHADQDVNTEQEEDDVDTVEDITEINIIDDIANNYQEAYNSLSIMQTPSAILILILIYFGLSIGLTFYQRSLLKVRSVIPKMKGSYAQKDSTLQLIQCALTY